MNDDVCTCAESGDEHACPYAVEINGVDADDESAFCTCCPECEFQCAMDI